MEGSRNMFTNGDYLKQYLFSGQAILTLVSTKTERRYTYKVVGKKNKETLITKYFVAVMMGTCNMTSYRYIGVLDKEVGFYRTRKSFLGWGDLQVKAFYWAVKQLFKTGQINNQVEFWHHGICGHCGKRLTVPESIERGLGPCCYKLLYSGRN